jgi:hypothetical protein
VAETFRLSAMRSAGLSKILDAIPQLLVLKQFPDEYEKLDELAKGMGFRVRV